jgi:glyceraldehyde 3-phosphate dehydrogenase
MVPTTTSATRLIRQVLPDLVSQLTSASVRVPVASVSAVDMTATLNTDVTVQSLNENLMATDPHIIGHTNQPLVSTDLRSRPESLILALPETMVTTKRQVRIFGWYDNEWGFSARMIDMAIRMADRPAP